MPKTKQPTIVLFTRIKIRCLFFFACPKKNQKKTPENETARFRGGIWI